MLTLRSQFPVICMIRLKIHVTIIIQKLTGCQNGKKSLNQMFFFPSHHYSPFNTKWKHLCALPLNLLLTVVTPIAFCFLYTQMVDRQMNIISLSQTTSHRSGSECFIFICIYMCCCALRTEKYTREKRRRGHLSNLCMKS